MIHSNLYPGRAEKILQFTKCDQRTLQSHIEPLYRPVRYMIRNYYKNGLGFSTSELIFLNFKLQFHASNVDKFN